jgi:hypothetical protein
VRVQAVADVIGLPMAIMSLPTVVLLTFGDGSPGFWPQTYIIKGSQTQNMGKLQSVDRWAKKLAGMSDVMVEKRIREHLIRKLHLETPVLKKDDISKSTYLKSPNESPNLSKKRSKSLGASVNDIPNIVQAQQTQIHKEQLRGVPHIQLDPPTQSPKEKLNPEKLSRDPQFNDSPPKLEKIDVNIENMPHMTSIEFIQNARMNSPRPILTISEPEIDMYIEELDLVVNAKEPMPPWVRIVSTPVTSTLLSVLWYVKNQPFGVHGVSLSFTDRALQMYHWPT